MTHGILRQFSSRLLPRNHQYGKKCFFSTKSRIYALGDGWTGSFGSGRLDQKIIGHEDEEDPDTPLLVYETDKAIQCTAVGWGHSAFISDDKLFLTGRPHEFSSLLRLARLPVWFRQYAVNHTHRTVQDGKESLGLHPTDIIGRTITFFSDIFLQETDWEAARMQSVLIDWTPMDLPEIPIHVSCSAGFTAVTGKSGKLYTFGLNAMGQCGTGAASNNVWEPKQVTGLSRASEDNDPEERIKLEQTHPIITSALGLQRKYTGYSVPIDHCLRNFSCVPDGLSLNSAGEVFSWGKGSRGQLGFDRVDSESHAAVPVQKAVFDLEANNRPVYKDMTAAAQISAGMIHSAALEKDSNSVYIWGKNILPALESSELAKYQRATDAHIPVRLRGLPDRQVLQISCGSHHTSMLLEDGSVWAVGISTDTQQPMFDPVCLIAAGAFDMPVRQFEAHMDRTTIVTASNQVLQVHLWEDPANQDVAVFTPPWALAMEADQKIKSVHRSWLHTIVATESNGI